MRQFSEIVNRGGLRAFQRQEMNLSAHSVANTENLQKLNFKDSQLQTVSKQMFDKRNYGGPAPFYLALK